MLFPALTDEIARALPMTGHRRAASCRLDIMPPPDAVPWTLLLVDSERRVAGLVVCRNGHMDRDWRRRASMFEYRFLKYRKSKSIKSVWSGDERCFPLLCSLSRRRRSVCRTRHGDGPRLGDVAHFLEAHC